MQINYGNLHCVVLVVVVVVVADNLYVKKITSKKWPCPPSCVTV